MSIFATAPRRIRCGALFALAAAGVAALSGCSTSRFAVGAMVPILENSQEAALRSNDTRTFFAATPGNLFLLEGLIATEPNNSKLRIPASMLYFSYAFSLNDRVDASYASLLYLKGFEHGKVALFRNKAIAAAWDKPFAEFHEALASLKKDDIPALVWTVANWSQFIAFHLDSTAVLVQIPRATALLERATEIDGGYFEGLPYMMLGSLHAFRPPIMGGDPEASRENFERARRVSGGKFLLADYLFAKFYTYRIQDGDLFEKTLASILKTPADVMPEYRLLNAVAKQKSAILLKEKDDLF